MNQPLLFAMAFAEWTCVDCRQVVQWKDAICLEYDDGKLGGVRHAECSAVPNE